MGCLLVIDADTAGRGIVRSRLIEAGHDVRVAGECALGIEAALVQHFDAVLIAAELDEGSTGVDICHNLRGHRELEDTPLIVYSLVCEDDMFVPLALEAGAHAAITSEQSLQLERAVEASMICRGRVGALRERQVVLRQEQRRLTEGLGRSVPSGAERAEHHEGTGYPNALLVVDGAGVVRWCDRDSWTLFGRSCVGANLRDIARSSGLDRFARSARTTAQHGFRFDLPGHGGVPGRPLVASVHPVGDDLRCLLLNDRGRREIVADDRSGGIEPRQVCALIDGAGRAYGLDRIPGDGPVAAHLRRSIAVRARDRDPLLLVGELGTGRAFLAHALHYQNPGGGAVLRVRCGSFSHDSLERELFGTSGDGIGRAGVVLLAGRGTLLLEDVDALPLGLQSRLLEVLLTHGVRRSGEQERETIHARMVATTSYDLGALAGEGRFLPELAEMLSTWRLDVPPLRHRDVEMASIIQAALDRAGAAGADGEVLRLLRQHCWLRNLEELEEVIEDAVRCACGGPVQVEHLSRTLTGLDDELPVGDAFSVHHTPGKGDPEGPPNSPWAIGTEDPISFEFYEKQAIVRALHACSGDRLAAARLLRVGKSTLYRKIRRFGIP